MKKLILTAVLLCVGAGFAWHHARGNGNQATALRTAAVERGDLVNLVSGTGTLNAVGTVEVGTQVSGTVAGILADFNDRVTAGQLLAVIDTANLAAAVRDAEASLARTRAQYEQAVADRDRNSTLYDRGYISEREFLALETVVTTSRASLASGEAAVERARTNLEHAWIRAPIAGTVIQRTIEAGQTVQANFSAPTLFIIAEDLERMEILAQVDESDIGRIREGQEVRFTVQAYPDEERTGAVRQIRLQPATVQNVVMYTVVIDAANPQGQLLPGMTATVDFVVDRAEDTLLLPNGALNFRPTKEMVADLREQRRNGGGSDDGLASRRPQGRATSETGLGSRSPTGDDSAAPSPDMAVIWHLDETGKPSPTRVRIGVSDGLKTALIDAGDLQAGSAVITGSSAGTRVAAATSAVGSRSGGMGGRRDPPGLF